MAALVQTRKILWQELILDSDGNISAKFHIVSTP